MLKDIKNTLEKQTKYYEKIIKDLEKKNMTLTDVLKDKIGEVSKLQSRIEQLQKHIKDD